jgi:hypothetical protein
MPTNPEWKWLEPISQQIVEELTQVHQSDPGGWTTARAVAALVGVPCSREFRTRLAILVERNILEFKNRSGYRLKMPVQAENNSPFSG